MPKRARIARGTAVPRHRLAVHDAGQATTEYLATLAAVIALGAGGAYAVSELEVVDRLRDAPLATFSAAPRDARLDYSTDSCSAPVVGSAGRSFDFTRACIRHDFAYRNTKRLGVFASRKRAIDARFLADMRAQCATRPRGQRTRCRRWAFVFHRAVTIFGR